MPSWLRRVGRVSLLVYAGLGLLYLFLPIFVIAAFSFNSPLGRFNFTWQGFTWDNWLDPFGVRGIEDALLASLRVGLLTTLFSVVLGTLVAVALVKYRFTGNKITNLFLVLPLTTPEVVLGASLLTMFLNVGVARGFWTIVLAHTMFCVAFVALTVKARIRGFDWTMEDAALDLGASALRTFRLVTLPLIAPGVGAAALLAFALSLDDFIITLFNAGDVVTFPVFVWGAARTAVPPQINVLGTAIIVACLILSVVGTVLQRRFGSRGTAVTALLFLGALCWFILGGIWQILVPVLCAVGVVVVIVRAAAANRAVAAVKAATR